MGISSKPEVITERLMEIINERPNYPFDLNELKRDIVEHLPGANTSRIGVIVKTLIEAGVLTGYVRGRNIRNVRLNQDQPVASSVSPQELEAKERHIRDLQEIIVGLQNKLRDNQTEVVKERVVEVQLKKGAKVVKKIKQIFHKEFPRLLDLAKARKNIFIYGPTGCGKSHVCAQLAESLGLRFAFVSCTVGMSEGVLAGRLLPVGDGGSFSYVISEFIDCYENGGVFLLDEIDAADPNVLLLVNAALANGKVAVPNRPEKPYAERHPDFVCVAAANTAGTNADRLYSGRNKLDGATLDRFQIGKVVFDYDQEVERQLCPDEELLTYCWKVRKAINANRLERAMSTRFIIDAYEMKDQFKWTHEQIFEAFFSGWRDDEKNKVLQAI